METIKEENKLESLDLEKEINKLFDEKDSLNVFPIDKNPNSAFALKNLLIFFHKFFQKLYRTIMGKSIIYLISLLFSNFLYGVFQLGIIELGGILVYFSDLEIGFQLNARKIKCDADFLP